MRLSLMFASAIIPLLSCAPSGSKRPRIRLPQSFEAKALRSDVVANGARVSATAFPGCEPVSDAKTPDRIAFACGKESSRFQFQLTHRSSLDQAIFGFWESLPNKTIRKSTRKINGVAREQYALHAIGGLRTVILIRDEKYADWIWVASSNELRPGAAPRTSEPYLDQLVSQSRFEIRTPPAAPKSWRPSDVSLTVTTNRLAWTATGDSEEGRWSMKVREPDSVIDVPRDEPTTLSLAQPVLTFTLTNEARDRDRRAEGLVSEPPQFIVVPCLSRMASSRDRAVRDTLQIGEQVALRPEPTFARGRSAFWYDQGAKGAALVIADRSGTMYWAYFGLGDLGRIGLRHLVQEHEFQIVDKVLGDKPKISLEEGVMVTGTSTKDWWGPWSDEPDDPFRYDSKSGDTALAVSIERVGSVHPACKGEIYKETNGTGQACVEVLQGKLLVFYGADLPNSDLAARITVVGSDASHVEGSLNAYLLALHVDLGKGSKWANLPLILKSGTVRRVQEASH